MPPHPQLAQTDDDAAQQAAREIAAARERANQAAEDYFAAESRLELLLLEQERLQVELTDLADVVAELKRAVEFVAINRFVSSGASGIPILTDLRAPTEQLQADVLAQVVAESGATTLDDYDEARARLREKEAELEATEAKLERQKVELVELQADAEAEVERLREVEGQRLQDEAVAAALLAEQLEAGPPVERNGAAVGRAARTADSARHAGGRFGWVVRRQHIGNLGLSGGEAGGRTGGGGPGTNPRAAGVGFLDGTILCPYGAGRRTATRGVPPAVVAVGTRASTCWRRPERRSRQ